MSKLKKRIILVCVVLSLVLTGTVAMFALAAEAVPMPTDKGLPRMRKDIYQMYQDGTVSSKDFGSYSGNFEVNENVTVSSGYSSTVSVHRGAKNVGSSNISVDFYGYGVMDVTLFRGAAFREEVANNFDLLQRFFVQTHATYGYKNEKISLHIGTDYTCDDLVKIDSYYSNYTESVLPCEKLSDSPYKNQHTWSLSTEGKATGTQFSYKLMDKSNAGKNGWSVEVAESGDHSADGNTIYQLMVTDNNGDRFRPANRSISYEELATLQLEVYMQSTDTLGDGRTYTIPAKAVGIREKTDKEPSAIIFEFYGDEWLNMEDQVVITGFKSVQVKPENGEAPAYDIWDMYANLDMTKKFGVTSATPVTDFAGHEIIWEGVSFSGKGGMELDRKEATVVDVELNFSNFSSPDGSTEAGYAESFSGPWDYVLMPTLVMNEAMYNNPEAVGKVAIQWNLRDENGEPVTSVLEYCANYTDRNGIAYSKLRFSTLKFEKGMTPQGERIVVEKVLNEHLLQDRIGNINLSNDILMTGDENTSVWPNAVSFLDTMAPTVTVQDAVVRQRATTDGNIESIQITVPFRVTDYDPGEGLMRSTASGTTAWLRLSNPIDGQEIEYRYAITYTTDFPAADAAGVDWYTGNLGQTGHSGYASFGVGEENTNLYLHMELSNLAEYEISEEDGLEIDLSVQDMVGNDTRVNRNIPITGVDNVAPEIALSQRKISVTPDGTAVSFSANIAVADTNGINLVEYRFVDSGEDAETAYTILYQKPADGDYVLNWSGSASQTFADDTQVNKILQVRSYDKNNNPSITSMQFSADLNKVISSYELNTDLFQPSDQSGILISRPIYNGVLSEHASTRITVVVPVEKDGMAGYEVYYRVIPAPALTSPVKALDPTSGDWYQAGTTIEHSLGYYVHQNVTKVEGEPGWVKHYGEMDVYVASSNLDMQAMNGSDTNTLILDPGIEAGGETDATYSWSRIGTVAYAGNVDDVYSMSYDKSNTRILLTDSTGTQIGATIKWEDPENYENELYRYAKFNQSISGVRVAVTLKNEMVREWGVSGIDFANSYAVLVRADENGTILKDDAGNYAEVTARVPLGNSAEQTLTVPDVAVEGESFTSGVYTWVVHVAQKGGGSSDFATGEVFLILDNAQVSDNFGVLSHTTEVQVVDGYWDPQYVTSTRTPENGEKKLSVVNIGIAKPTAMIAANPNETGDNVTYTFQETLEQVDIDGVPAYFKGIANSSKFESGYQSYHNGNFTITADMTQSGYGIFLGEEVGTVQGIRFWNKANVDDYTTIEYIQKDQSYRDSSERMVIAEFSQENGVAKLDVSFNVAWYIGNSNPLFESAEALREALPGGQFGVINGENTICYQLVMDNGRESPIYQFTLNLVDEVPRVNVDFVLGPYFTDVLGETEPRKERNVEYVDLIFSDMFSMYSGLEVYHVEFVEGGFGDFTFYDIRKLTDEQITNGYRIDYGCSGYDRNYNYDNFGYQGTSITGRLNCTGSESFFVILDHSGNAVTIYPIDSYEYRQSFYTFMPDELIYLEGKTPNGMNQVRLTNSAGASVNLDYADRIDFRIDANRASTEEEKNALWVTHNTKDAVVSVPNDSGFAEVQPSYYGTLGFAVPYDPDKPETEMISHTVDVRINGEVTPDGGRSFAYEDSVTFEAPNTKPAVVSVEARGGCIVVTYNMAVSTDEGASNVAYIPVDDAQFGTQGYAHTFRDLFGNEYTELIDIPEQAADPVVTYSTKEITTEPVVVTITSADTLSVKSDADWTKFTEDYEVGLYYDAAKDAYYDINKELYCTFEADAQGEPIRDEDGYLILTHYLDPEYQIQVEGDQTGEIVLTTNKNFETDVMYSINGLDGELAAYVEVRNIIKSADVDPYLSWNYAPDDVVDGVVYGDVTVYLMDRNDQILLDPATGESARFTFYPGGPTSHTFTGCYSHATNTPVPDVTAKLEVTLQTEPISEPDTLAPDVDVVAYLSDDTGARAANMVYRKSTGRFLMTNYAFRYDMTEEECYHDDINEMIAGMGWSKSYMFHLDVYDESRVRLILSKDIVENGITYDTRSETVEGVTLVGRTLQVTKNCEFALYIVDEENNITPLHIKVSNLSGAPVPELVQVESKTADGKPAVRVYLLPPQVVDYENLMITNVGKLTDNEEYEGMTSDYFGLDYMLYDAGGRYEIGYSYTVPGYTAPFTGTISTDVAVPTLVTPAVSTYIWSANYFNKATNQDISLNLKLNTPVKNISVVYSVDETDHLIDRNTLEEAGVYVGFFQKDVTITFEQNTAALEERIAALMPELWGKGKIRLMLTEMEYGTIGYYELPRITNLDRTAPALDGAATIEYPENAAGVRDYKSAVITLKLNETVLSRDGSQKGTTFTYTVRENKTYTYHFMDEAGNVSSFDVEVADLITQPLTITLSTSASDAGIIAEPASYEAEIGQTLYAKTNRDATIFIYGEGSEETTTPVAKDSWTAITVTENSMGLHPSVVARDNYGNLAIVQLEYIPIKDITAPAAFLHRDMISVAATATDAQIEAALLANILYSDDTTATDDLTVTVSYDRIASGRTVATYVVTDEEGNETIRQCWLRIRSGLEPVIHVNGELVEDGAFLYVTDRDDLDITVEYDGDVAEPYKLVYEEGDLRSWAKLKDGNWLTSGYQDQKAQAYQVKDLGDGWYSFALTTQGMEIYYFQVHVGQING